MSMTASLLPLVPYAMDLAGGVCIAWPWLEDQKLRSLIQAGERFKQRPDGVLRELGEVMQQEGWSGLVAVDRRQQRIVKVGIGLLCCAFATRVAFTVAGLAAH